MSFRLERRVRRYVEERSGATSTSSAWAEEPGASGYVGSSDDRIVAVLIRKLDSTDSRAALAVEQDLLAVGERAVPRLIEALGYCPWMMRARMVRVLGKLGAADALPGLLEYFSKAQTERTAIRPGSPTARDLIAPWLIGLEESDRSGVDERVYFRIQAMLAFRAIGGSRAIRALCVALEWPACGSSAFCGVGVAGTGW